MAVPMSRNSGSRKARTPSSTPPVPRVSPRAAVSCRWRSCSSSPIYFLAPLVWLIFSATKSKPDFNSTFGFWFSPQPQFFTNLARRLYHR